MYSKIEFPKFFESHAELGSADAFRVVRRCYVFIGRNRRLGPKIRNGRPRHNATYGLGEGCWGRRVSGYGLGVSWPGDG